jgi:hypothetical protein
MASSYYPRTVTDGLSLFIDAGNDLSYPRSGTSITDLTTRNTSTTINGPTFTGLDSGAWVFDGVNDYLRTPTLKKPPTGDFTIESWVYPTTITGDYRIISCNQAIDNFQLILTNTGVLQLYMGTLAAATTATVSTNVWTHVVATRLGSAVTLYLNSVSRATSTNSTAINTTYLDIGYRTSNNNHPFNGRIASYRLYSRCLTQSEVTQNFSAIRGRFGV